MPQSVRFPQSRVERPSEQMCSLFRTHYLTIIVEINKEAIMALQIGDIAPDFEADTTEGRHQVPRLYRRLLGGVLLPPQGFHARVHDRARLRGQDEA